MLDTIGQPPRISLAGYLPSGQELERPVAQAFPIFQVLSVVIVCYQDPRSFRLITVCP
jgi:hypothetical protein